MSYRTGPRSDLDFTTTRRPRGYDDDDMYERRSDTRSQPRRAPPVREYEEVDISLRDRERDRAQDRVPHFMREERQRTEAGPMVLRQREVETFDQRRRPTLSRRPSSSSSEERIRPIPHRHTEPPRHAHDVHVDIDTRISNRRRRSPSPEFSPEREREIRIIERERERVPSPSPSPPPPPQAPPVVRGPTVERDVITHYTDVDHGVVRARQPSPSPPPPPKPRRSRTRERETDIDIHMGRHETDVDIHRHARSRSRPRERPERPRPRPHSSHRDSYEIDIDDKKVTISDHHHHPRRRAQSVSAPRPDSRPDYSDEADYITGKIDSRGRMGEAWHGATRDWTIVDVPPGTERVQMDGAGGGGAEVTWQRYNGVRRARFQPERDAPARSSDSLPMPEAPSKDHELSIEIYKSPERERSRDVEIDEVHDRRISIRDSSKAPPKQKKAERDMWTEITKDLVMREAIEDLGYDYEETEFFFYVMQYLRYEDVLELVNLSDDLRRRQRKHRARQMEYEREMREDYDRHHYYHDHHYRLPRRTKWDDHDDKFEMERKREYLYDRGPTRGYAR